MERSSFLSKMHTIYLIYRNLQFTQSLLEKKALLFENFNTNEKRMYNILLMWYITQLVTHYFGS